MIKLFTYCILILLTLSFNSCSTREKIVYFQQSTTDSTSTSGGYTPVLKLDDFLAVKISGDDPESVIPFNEQETNVIATGYTNGTPALNGYLIDGKGEITLPVIGKLKVVGLNRLDAAALIEEKLKDFVKNPIVQIQIQNYKITVLGDVKVPGTYKIPNERITILEAIGLAGDLNLTGNRKNVLVIRDDNGIKTEYRIDLRKKDLFSSPAYYLTQNDVVYIEPNHAKRTESTLWRTSGPIFISMASLIITTLTFFTIN